MNLESCLSQYNIQNQNDFDRIIEHRNIDYMLTMYNDLYVQLHIPFPCFHNMTFLRKALIIKIMSFNCAKTYMNKYVYIDISKQLEIYTNHFLDTL